MSEGAGIEGVGVAFEQRYVHLLAQSARILGCRLQRFFERNPLVAQGELERLAAAPRSGRGEYASKTVRRQLTHTRDEARIGALHIAGCSILSSDVTAPPARMIETKFSRCCPAENQAPAGAGTARRDARPPPRRHGARYPRTHACNHRTATAARKAPRARLRSHAQAGLSVRSYMNGR